MTDDKPELPRYFDLVEIRKSAGQISQGSRERDAMESIADSLVKIVAMMKEKR